MKLKQMTIVFDSPINTDDFFGEEILIKMIIDQDKVFVGALDESGIRRLGTLENFKQEISNESRNH